MSTTIIDTEKRIKRAAKAFSKGRPVLVYDSDDREGEVDMIYSAESVKPEDVARLRNEAGGLVCVAMAHDVCSAFELPYLSKELSHSSVEDGILEYGDRSSFSIPVNHRDTRTGITDIDRSRTIRELANAANDPGSVDFGATFRSPGHVPILRAAPNLLSDRQGHTELSLVLAHLANCPPASVVCEMIDDETGRAISDSQAIMYAENYGIPYLDGRTLCEYVDVV